MIKIDNSIWNNVLDIYYSPSCTRRRHEKSEPTKTKTFFNIVLPSVKTRVTTVPLLTDNSLLQPIFTSLCPECYSDQIHIIHKDAILVCIKCGYILNTGFMESESSTINSLNFTYVRKNKIKRLYTADYQKRKNHFKYWLYRLQGKEHTNISPEDLQLLKCTITSKYDKNFEWDYTTMKACLKSLKREKWYNHIYFILRYVCDKPLVEFTSYHEDILIDQFVSIQRSFQENRGNRINMLNYAYLLKKFTEIQGWVHLSDQIPYMKSHTKLFHLDRIWKKICKECGLPFIPSIQ